METAEQKRAIDSRKRQVIVTASAGAGKTSTMVSRVIDLITKDHVPVASIVMLTFTEAAAAEMKSRLADALIGAIKKASGEERAALTEAIDFLPLLHCSTIDSFCYSLVRSHFELLGLSPLHSLMEETLAASYRERAMKEVLSDFARESISASEGDFGSAELSRYYDFMASFGGREERALEHCIYNLYDYAETTEDGDAFLKRAREIAEGDIEEHPAVKAYLRSVRVKTEDALARLSDLALKIPDSAPNMAKKCAYYVNTMRDFLSCESLLALTEIVGKIADAPRLSSSENNLYPDLYNETERAGEIFKEWKREILLTDNSDRKTSFFSDYQRLISEICGVKVDLVQLLDLTCRFKARYHAIKEEERVMDFADVEHFALTLLRDFGVGEEIGCEYLLVDECQDLNPLQDALMRLVAGKNHLFIVGDVKQSIYRFRLSDPELFHERVERGERDPEGAEVVHFNENFRSSDAVIDFVNVLFSSLMNRDFGGVYHPATRGERRFGSGDVQCFFYSKAEEKPECDRVYSVRAADEKVRAAESISIEAEWIRDRIRELIGTELRDTRDDAPFTVSYKDIAILAPSGMKPGKVQEKVVNCLRAAGIPLNLGDFVRDAEHPEIAAIVDFLRLIESPMNDYALLSVMRSDLFDFSLDEIATISLGEGETFWSKAEAAAKAGESKVKAFYDYLDRMRFLSSALSLFDLVSLLVEERLRIPLMNRPDGRKVFGDVLAFLNTLKQGRATASISEYIPYFDKYFKMEGGSEVSERDAVSVMTIHKSKGMQFPIVFVIGLGEAIVNVAEAQERVRMDKEFGVIKRGVEEKNLIFALFRVKKIKELREDKLRLLYVALTRAKNYLYLSGELPEGREETPAGKANRLSEWVSGAIRGRYPILREYHPNKIDLDKKFAEGAREDISELIREDAARLERAFAYRYPHEIATKTGIKYTVTAINAMDEGDYYPPTMLFPEEKKAKGTAFHAVMEHIPFTLETEEETALFLRKLEEDGVLVGEEAKGLSAKRVLDAVRKVKSLVGDAEILREKSFLLHLPACEAGVAAIEDEVEVQGKIDLVALGKEEAIVLDYKLSGLPSDALAEKYHAQLDLYALAVREGFGVRSVKKYIFVLGRNEIIEL